MLSVSQSTSTASPPPPLSSRKELFSLHVARGASLAQAARQGRVERAIERLDRIIDMAMELQRPTAALKAMDLQLKLAGVIRDTRAGLYADSPDDDLSKAFSTRGRTRTPISTRTPTRPPPKRRFLFPNPTNPTNQPNRKTATPPPAEKSN